MEKRIVLIGAGSAQFGYGTIGDVLQSQVLEGSHIVLHDINPNTLAAVEKTGRAFIEEHKLPFTISASTNRAEAFTGADFLIISIEVGNRFDLWEQDWRIPQQYGVRQVYGENGGPGGLFHSLRIIPPILEICADIMKIAGDGLQLQQPDEPHLHHRPPGIPRTEIHRHVPRDWLAAQLPAADPGRAL
jgi:alpha-galactosidase